MIITKRLVQRVGACARCAGKALVQHFNAHSFTTKEKPHAGLVTSADTITEASIIRQLRALDPDVAFLAEEGGKTGKNDWEWVIDPIDGTNNFAYGIPYFCISIALTYQGHPQLGVIHNPLRHELFWAIKNGGAWCGNIRIHTAKRPLKQSFIALSVPYDDHNVPWEIQARQISDHVRDLRRMGAAALDLAYVAAGRFDGAFFQNLSWWDIAAGILLIQEAGGIVTDFNLKPINQKFQSLIAATPIIHTQLTKIIRS